MLRLTGPPDELTRSTDPYRTIDDLPAFIRMRLPHRAQHMRRAALTLHAGVMSSRAREKPENGIGRGNGTFKDRRNANNDAAMLQP